jgi:hypothetical protein
MQKPTNNNNNNKNNNNKNVKPDSNPKQYNNNWNFSKPNNNVMQRGQLVIRGRNRNGRFIRNIPARRTNNNTLYSNKQVLDNNKRNSNINQSKKLSCILDPSNAIKNSMYYSIFPSDDKVIRQSLYTMNTVEVSPAGMRLMWLPNGVGFSQNFAELDIATQGDGTTQPDKFSNLLSATSQTQLSPLSTTTSQIPGRYRLISSMLKITNTTPLTSRGGSYFVAKFTIEKGSPIYYSSENPDIDTTTGDATIYPNIMFRSSLTNVATKQLISGTQIGEIHYLNIDEGNKIFSNYNEYIQAEYTSNNNELTYASIDINNDKGVIGNNDSYIINFAKPNVSQTYIIEQFQVFEVIPDPNTNMGNMAQKSFQRLTDYQMRVLKQYNPIKAY